MQQATGLGRMAFVGLSEDEAREFIKPLGERLSIGAVNGPRNIVLSGETAVLEEALAALTARHISHRKLPVQYAFHSAQMKQFGDELVAQLGEVRTASPTVAVYSTVTGSLAENVDFDATYFGRNLREPVRFANAMQAMLNDGCSVAIEVGPHPVLGSAIAECAENAERSPIILASLRRGRHERESAMQACAGAYVAGCNLTWEHVQPNSGRVVDLPTYPWQRKRYWLRKSPTRHLRVPAGEGVPALEGMRFVRDEPSGAPVSENDGMLYEITWQRASAQRPSEPCAVAGSWLLFADRGGTADALAARIQAAGGSCWRVLVGDEFERIGERCWVLNPAVPEHFNQLLAQGGWRNGEALRGVVYC